MKENLATKEEMATLSHELVAMERRTDQRIDSAKDQLLRVIVGNGTETHHEFQAVNVRLDSMGRQLGTCVTALSGLLEWSNKYESELVRISKELFEVQARLARLENPAA